MAEYLIVVDMQRDFVDGALGSPEAVSIVPNVVEKINGHFRAGNGPVIFTYDTHGMDYLSTLEGSKLPIEHCIEGTAGWELYPEIDALAKQYECITFNKPTFGAKELAEYLAKENEKETIERIDIIGLCTDICVISNAMLIKAFLPDVPIYVDSSCCAGVSTASHENALDAMRMCQIEIY